MNAGKTSALTFVLVVFAAVAAYAGSFTDNGDGTITDANTGLVWQQGGDGFTKTWEDALAYCEGLSLASQTDWRLPNVRELRSLVDITRYSPSIDTIYFPAAKSSNYWSSTTQASTTTTVFAWRVLFTEGGVTTSDKSTMFYVRCVRGGK